MDKIQLIFFFAGGFFISRLIIKVKLPQRLFIYFVGQNDNSIAKIAFYVIAVAALLSFFIPNAITVLTLLPLLEILRQYLEKHYSSDHSVPTILVLATIYGANIGGMGSITATPANGILVSYAELNHVAGIEKLSFLSWLVWGIPLVIAMVALAWGIIIAVFRPWRYGARPIALPVSAVDASYPRQGFAVIITMVYFFSCLVLSALTMEFPGWVLSITVATGLITLGLTALLFLLPLAGSAGQRLLVPADCVHDLPKRGFLFVAVAVLLAGVLYLFGINDYFADWIAVVVPDRYSVLGLFLIIALITSFTTEILSNTAVQLSLFTVVPSLASALGFSPLLGLLIVTLSCTSAFMSPIATGVNGLAFGGIRGASLGKMLVVGFFMNVAGALGIALWVFYVVGGFYGL